LSGQQQDFYCSALEVGNITLVQDREGVVHMHNTIMGEELQHAPHSISTQQPLGGGCSDTLASSSRSSIISSSSGSSSSASALPVVGIDCEWQPYKKGMPKSPVALLQVATRQQVFVVDLLAICRQPGHSKHNHIPKVAGVTNSQPTQGPFSASHTGAECATTGSSSSTSSGGGSSSHDGCCEGNSLTPGEAALACFLQQLLGHSDIRVVGFGLQGDLQRLAKSYPWLLHRSCAAGSSSSTSTPTGCAAGSSTSSSAHTSAQAQTDSPSYAQDFGAFGQTLWISAESAASRIKPRAARSPREDSEQQQQWVVHKAVELQQLSKLAGTDTWQGSLSALVERTLGRPLDKSQQASNWAARPLSEAQMLYAANDAHVLTVLFDHLSEQLASSMSSQ
jgi:hypothetical protein